VQKCARECGKTDNGEPEGEVVYVNCLGVEFFGAGASRDGTLYIAVVFYSPTGAARLLEPTPGGTLSVVTIELMLDYLEIVTLLVLRGLRVTQAPTTTTTVDTTEGDRPGPIASVLTPIPVAFTVLNP